MKRRRSAPRVPPRGRLLAADPTPRGAKSVPQRRLEASIALFEAELHARGSRPRTIDTYAKVVRALDPVALLELAGIELLLRWGKHKPSTRATYLAAVKAYRRSHAARDLGVSLGELADVRVLQDAPSPRPLRPDEERRLERKALASSDPRVRLWYALMRELGLRPTEALELQWADVVLDPGRETVSIRGVKGRKDVALPVERGGRCDLLRLLRRAHPGGGHLHRWILPSSRDGGISSWSYGAALDAWHALCRDAGVSATPHQLRHTAATAWLDAGVDSEIVRRLLRHRSSAMLARYVEVSPEGLRKALRRGS